MLANIGKTFTFHSVGVRKLNDYDVFIEANDRGRREVSILLNGFQTDYIGEGIPQSRQIAKLLLQSSKN